MSSILKVLIKSFAWPFYKSHSGMLFFVFFLMFGIVESSQILYYHQSLIYGIFDSTVFLVLVLSLWLLYQLKALHFFIELTDQREYQLFHELGVISSSKTFFYLLIVTFITFQPIFIYSLFIYAIGLTNGFYFQCLIILFFQLLILSMNALFFTLKIYNSHKSGKLKMPVLIIKMPVTQTGIYLAYLLNKEKLAIIISKLFSLTLIYVVKETLDPGDDFRIIALAWLFALTSHTYLIFKIKSFEDHSLTWTRSLPTTRLKIFTSYALLYVLLFFPELILSLGAIGNGITPLGWLQLALLTASFLVTVHVYLYKPDRNPENFIHLILFLFLSCFVLVLSKFTWPLIGGLLAISYISFHRYYFQYQALPANNL